MTTLLAQNTPILSTVGLTKTFGANTVLSDISLDINAGEVHAVIGENGAGKSTLMKILAGNHTPSGGSIHFQGQEVRFSGPTDAEAKGIVLVHQEILLAPDLTVAQNIYLGREITRGISVDDKTMNAGADAAIRRLGAIIEPKRILNTLSIAQRQLVQIARALLVPHQLVIFDEPTASLTPVETEALLNVIRQIRKSGVSVLYISHRLGEVKDIADRVTVLRDGKHVTTRDASELTPHMMAELMVGRDVSKLYPQQGTHSSSETVLEARALSVPGYVKEASFSLKQGEILGFGGLVGAGRTELLEGVVGLRPSCGDVWHRGVKQEFNSVAKSMAAGIVYLTEDRKGKGLLLQENLAKNLTLSALKKFVKNWMISRSSEDAALDQAIQEFDIRTRDKKLLSGQLSGGNQQKLLIGKMMLLDPQVIIIDEPTRGIDIGTKEQIYRFIADLAASGKSVVVISSEMQELIGLCDRIIVMREGVIAGEVSGDDMNENNIVLLATGVNSREAA
jgi:ribose transport system ATP-binding protein